MILHIRPAYLHICYICFYCSECVSQNMVSACASWHCSRAFSLCTKFAWNLCTFNIQQCSIWAFAWNSVSVSDDGTLKAVIKSAWWAHQAQCTTIFDLMMESSSVVLVSSLVIWRYWFCWGPPRCLGWWDERGWQFNGWCGLLTHTVPGEGHNYHAPCVRFHAC